MRAGCKWGQARARPTAPPPHFLGSSSGIWEMKAAACLGRRSGRGHVGTAGPCLCTEDVLVCGPWWGWEVCLSFLYTCTCSSKRVAAAVTDQGRTENQGVTVTLSASGERHPGSFHGHRTQASVSSPAPATGFFSLRLT